MEIAEQRRIILSQISGIQTDYEREAVSFAAGDIEAEHRLSVVRERKAKLEQRLSDLDLAEEVQQRGNQVKVDDKLKAAQTIAVQQFKTLHAEQIAAATAVGNAINELEAALAKFGSVNTAMTKCSTSFERSTSQRFLEYMISNRDFYGNVGGVMATKGLGTLAPFMNDWAGRGMQNKNLEDAVIRRGEKALAVLENKVVRRGATA